MTKLKNRVISLKKNACISAQSAKSLEFREKFSFSEMLQIFAQKNSNILYDPNFFKTDGVT